MEEIIKTIEKRKKTMLNELKPCPFCGGEVEIVECGEHKFDGWIQIAHKVPFIKNCRVFMECEDFFNLFDIVLLEKKKKELAEKWNRRAENAEIH